jgi:hypothetical protein
MVESLSSKSPRSQCRKAKAVVDKMQGKRLTLSMPIFIDKLLTALILPLGISLSLGAAAAALLWVGRQRLAGLLLVLSLTCYGFSRPR